MWDSRIIRGPLDIHTVDDNSFGVPVLSFDRDVGVLAVGSRGESAVKFFDVPETRDSVIYLNDYSASGGIQGMCMVPDLKLDERELTRSTDINSLLIPMEKDVMMLKLQRSSVLNKSISARLARERRATQEARQSLRLAWEKVSSVHDVPGTVPTCVSDFFMELDQVEFHNRQGRRRAVTSEKDALTAIDEVDDETVEEVPAQVESDSGDGGNGNDGTQPSGMFLRRFHTDPNTGTLKQGHLTKQGGKRKTWKRRFFKLFPHSLKYYKPSGNDSATEEVGAIPLHGGAVVELGGTGKSDRPHQFSLTPLLPSSGYRTYYLQCESSEDLSEWVAAISEALELRKHLYSLSVSADDEVKLRLVCDLERTIDDLADKLNEPDQVDHLLWKLKKMKEIASSDLKEHSIGELASVVSLSKLQLFDAVVSKLCAISVSGIGDLGEGLNNSAFLRQEVSSMKVQHRNEVLQLQNYIQELQLRLKLESNNSVRIFFCVLCLVCMRSNEHCSCFFMFTRE